MMKLRNMIKGLADGAAASALAARWAHDEGTLSFRRASSNFVYELNVGGQRHFLRFVSGEDNQSRRIEAELEHVRWLAANGFSCAVPVPSKAGELVETVELPEGSYHGVLFTEADGVALEAGDMDVGHLHVWGQSLAAMHRLTKSYNAPAMGDVSRDWRSVLAWMEAELAARPGEFAAMVELARLREWLESLASGTDAVGLIHFDYQPDNLFWDERRQSFSAIDFDDVMVHWYAMDVIRALSDLMEEGTSDADGKIDGFLAGYRTVTPLGNEWVRQFPNFQRFDRLYSYVRVLRSMDDSELDGAPAWYEGLRVRLRRMLNDRRAEFAKCLPLE